MSETLSPTGKAGVGATFTKMGVRTLSPQLFDWLT
jgi:hypothetical protein